MTAEDHERSEDRRFYDAAPCGYLTTDADGVVVRANATLLEWLGVAPGALDGRPFADLLRPGARVVWLTHHVPRLEQAGRIDAVALELLRADGSVLPVLVSAATADTSEGARPDVLMTVVDASERQAYERELVRARNAAERAEWRLRALQRVTEACSGAARQDELFASIATALEGSLELGCVRIWLASGDDLTLAATTCEETGSGPDDRVQQAWWSGRPVLPAGVAVSPAWAAVPWLRDGTTWAVVEVCVEEAWRGTVDDLGVLPVMGAVVGQALDRVRLHERLERLAKHDDLTGLPNRLLFLETLDRALAWAGRRDRPVALMFVDLDGFKAVNDEHGHDAGDTVLEVTAERLRATVRAGDLVGRLGGDEFVALCPEADETVVAEVAARVRTALAEPVQVGTVLVRVGASVGTSVARPPFGEQAAADLLAAGDAAMYAEKRGADPTNGT
ncbi:MAG TPA: sensor domain-containing diguanylate cyclase [Nocardioides sp.]|nr:sensor domain-containing diguanylate cyclase [Nocardioides sp.]